MHKMSSRSPLKSRPALRNFDDMLVFQTPKADISTKNIINNRTPISQKSFIHASIHKS
jgi:hypothetical protein